MSRRRPIRFLPVALLVPVALGAQTPAHRHVDVPAVAPRAADVATVDGIVKAYYDVITGPTGQPRQWSRDVFSDHVATRLVRNAHGDSSGVRGAAWLWE